MWEDVGKREKHALEVHGDVEGHPFHGNQWTDVASDGADPAAFIAARNESARGGFLSPLSPEDLKGERVFLSNDGKVGFVIHKDGDFGNLFNNGGPKGAGQRAIIQAIREGATTLDCFDKFLPELYSKFGFVPTGRMKFNDEYAPPGWNFERDGRPDVVFMAYNGGDRSSIHERVGSFAPYDQRGGSYYDDYDQAKADSRAAAVHGHDDSKRNRHAVADRERGRGGLRGEALGLPTRPDGVHPQPVSRFSWDGVDGVLDSIEQHGDVDGHPFHGNQYTDGSSGGGDKLPGREVTYAEAKTFMVAKNVTDKERNALNDYIGPAYANVNDFLRTNGDGFGSDYDLAISLDSVMAKTEPLKEDVLVYRGVSGEFAKELETMPVGTSFTDRGFCSTSVDKGMAGSFKGYGPILEINLPKGTKALAVDAVADDWATQNEDEVLLPRGMSFEIVGKTGEAAVDEDGNYRQVIHLRAFHAGRTQVPKPKRDPHYTLSVTDRKVRFADWSMDNVEFDTSKVKKGAPKLRDQHGLVPSVMFDESGGDSSGDGDGHWATIDGYPVFIKGDAPWGGDSYSPDWDRDKGVMPSYNEAIDETRIPDGLTADEGNALKSYMGTQYTHINGVLRHPAKYQSESDPYGYKKEYKQFADQRIAHLDSMFEKVKPLSRDYRVLRGVGSGDFATMIEGLKPGTKFTDMGFTSTTVDHNAAFYGVKLDIRVPKGFKALAVEAHAHNGGESEVLLPRGTTFKVCGRYTSAKGVQFIRLRVIQGTRSKKPSIRNERVRLSATSQDSRFADWTKDDLVWDYSEVPADAVPLDESDPEPMPKWLKKKEAHARELHGDVDGHPFHGNQWTDGHGGDGDAKEITYPDAIKMGLKAPFQNDHEEDSIIHYTGNGYVGMNSLLRTGEVTPGYGTNNSEAEHIKTLDRVFDRAEPLKAGVVVWRGAGHSAFGKSLETAPIGTAFQDHGYTSTTTDSNRTFGGTKLQIEVPAGLKAMAVNMSEKEILLARGTIFKVVGRQTIPGTALFPPRTIVKLRAMAQHRTGNMAKLSKPMSGEAVSRFEDWGDEMELVKVKHGIEPTEAHGDVDGHPFHGNQWTEGGGDGKEEGDSNRNVGPDGQPLIRKSDLEQIGGQAGSNKGGLFKAADGTKYYVKLAKSQDHASNEVLAAALYREAGSNAPEVQFADWDGKPGIASKIEPVENPGGSTPSDVLANTPGVLEGFATDAWLANWDVVGLENDNLAVSNGRALRLDTGGALFYRAQGGPKGSAFGSTVTEIKTLRDPNMNSSAASVFGRMTYDQLVHSMERVTTISDSRIMALCDKLFPSRAKELSGILIARKADIARQREALLNKGKKKHSYDYESPRYLLARAEMELALSLPADGLPTGRRPSSERVTRGAELSAEVSARLAEMRVMAVEVGLEELS